MRIARLKMSKDGYILRIMPDGVDAIHEFTHDSITSERSLVVMKNGMTHKTAMSSDEAEAEINAALRDIEGAEQRTRLDELLSDCLRKEAADDTA